MTAEVILTSVRDSANRIEWVRTRDRGVLGVYPSIVADRYDVRLLRLRAGITTLLDGEPTDRILLVVEEDLVLVDAAATNEIRPYDLVTISANWDVAATVVASRDAILCEMSSKGTARTNDSQLAVLTWTEQRRRLNTDYPDADLWGFHRGTYPRAEAGGVSCNLVIQPSAQTSPRHVKPWDCVFLQLRGETAFGIGVDTFSLRPKDLLLVPAGNAYRYTNVGTEVALFASIAGVVPPGQKATYFDLQRR